MSYFSSDDLYHFNNGTATSMHKRFGAHVDDRGADYGTHFAVWAPAARSVQLIGDFNFWTAQGLPMASIDNSGVWYVCAPDMPVGALYKYRIEGLDGSIVEKADPLGFSHEIPPRTASRVTSLEFQWNDKEWMNHRGPHNALNAPISCYEVHLGSWQRESNGQQLSYRQVAPLLVDYVLKMGFTHVEFMPLTEHPFYGSWGYQVTGYFAATSRYGDPQDLMFLIDSLHRAGIGVILDWVPAHFPVDDHGLGKFDGTHLYEHADPRAGFHPDWKTYIFNYGRHEVRSFLISSALFWLEHYHIDGLRVDGVASMLYLDYSRKPGEWIPNKDGGNQNLEAIRFLQELNTAVYREFPDVQTFAEESTSFPQVSHPVDTGGLGFGFKWDMGWMHDSLQYFSREPIHRSHHQNELTQRGLWAFSENFCLPLSHDEVVHGKGSLLARMPGDDWQRFANLRLLYAHLYGTPGKKLLFMGCEFAQHQEWNHDSQLQWNLIDKVPTDIAIGHTAHSGVQALVRALNQLYRQHPPLHSKDCDSEGFEWVHCNDTDNCVLAYWRRGDAESSGILVLLNLTPVPRTDYRVGVPLKGAYRLLLDTDDTQFGGSGYGEQSRTESVPIPSHGRADSIIIDLSPLSACFWQIS